MDGAKINGKRADEAFDRSLERDEEAHSRFRTQFEELMAGGEPGDGVTRMQRLEELTRYLRTELDSSILTYVSGMVASLDESEIIDSKGGSSSGAASS